MHNNNKCLNLERHSSVNLS